ncbi:hypothetical protein IE53DRAFT_314843 [Violaceomyces palustris]|uniref:Uncharacterized protein n=1 Tax=Violaceomyces palustris TaxID=1673888 RepID=A0ACD0NYJ5_9BASI|nr:hypothetical protein IE53DRAFT_314843 [Violaceomyces palustris]
MYGRGGSGGGGGGYGSNWQNPNNPNMAPLPPRPPRGGIGSTNGPPSATAYGARSPNGSYNHQAPSMAAPSVRGLPPPVIGGASSPVTGIAPAPSASSGGGAEVATTLFVGSISPGVTDEWLTKLLEACGSLRNLKRVSKGFGFAEYREPDSVLRAISVLNGKEIPSMGSDSGSPPKKLVVKADEKTKKFLEQYEQTRIKTDDDDKNEDSALKSVSELIEQMSDPNAVQEDSSKPAYEVPAHLKDLPPEELPEEHRGSVLSEIEQFRQAAAAREEANKKRDQELERQRAAERARRQGAAAAASAGGANGRGYGDAQSYQKPVGFVPPSQDQRPADDIPPEEQDELEEKRRRERREYESKAAAAEAERLYTVKERQRLAYWEKEAEKDRKEAERAEKEAVMLLRKWEDWSDELALNREPFYMDKSRWRHNRAQLRRREEEADERDRAEELAEEEAARKETERFLAQQAAEMAALTEQQRAAGILVPGEGGMMAPLKLNITNASKTEPIGAANAGNAGSGGVGILGEEEEEDTSKKASRLKQIELGDNLTAEQREEQRLAQVKIVEDSIPADAEGLFKMQPRWEWIDEDAMQGKYKSWTDGKITENVGEPVPELVDFVVESLQAHKSAEDLVEGLEPVLAEDAQSFVISLWKMIVVDSLIAAAGLAI